MEGHVAYYSVSCTINRFPPQTPTVLAVPTLAEMPGIGFSCFIITGRATDVAVPSASSTPLQVHDFIAHISHQDSVGKLEL